jgi:D-glycero-D-manno-heptose 1,7-bisphosphate phosphatase
MLIQAAKELNIDLTSSFMIGDRWRDVDCGFNAGCRTVFIDWSYDEKLKKEPDFRALDLLNAAQIIQRQEREEE